MAGLHDQLDGGGGTGERRIDADLVSDVYEFIDGISIEEYRPETWYKVLKSDVETSLVKTTGQLKTIEATFKSYVVGAPLAAVALTVAFYALGRFGWGGAGGIASDAMIAGSAGAAAIVITLMASVMTWDLGAFQHDRQRRRFYEMRDRNWRALEHRLKTRQSLYKEQSMNEDPEVGPKGLMGSRLLGRHAWELWYRMNIRSFIFGLNVDDHVFLPSRQLMTGGVVGVSALLLAFSFLMAHPDASMATSVVSDFLGVMVWPSAAGLVAFVAVSQFWTMRVKTKLEDVKALFRPKLTERAMRVIGVRPDEYNGSLDWPEQYGYDDLDDFLPWLKSRFEILGQLRDQKYPYATTASAAEAPFARARRDRERPPTPVFAAEETPPDDKKPRFLGDEI